MVAPYKKISIQSSHVRRSGFSLLEMAIVIVVIGLIIGAVTATTSFLNSAKMNNMMTESKYYINAFQQFSSLVVTRHSIPGDFNYASSVWPTAVNGDGNGLVRAGATANNSELFGVFQHLSLAGLIKGQYTGATTGGVGTAIAVAGKNIPGSVMDGVGYLFDHPNALDGNVSGDSLYFDGKYAHVLRVAKVTAGGLPSTAFLTPSDAMKIDDKYDDGAPGKGWIRTPNATASSCATSATVYNVSSSSTLCYFIFNMNN